MKQFESVLRKLSYFDPAPYNPRTMSEDALEALGESLEDFGLVQPLVVNLRTVGMGWSKKSRPALVGGHQRVRTMSEKGIGEFQCIEVDIDEADEMKLNLTLNNQAMQGQFIPDMVADMISCISKFGGGDDPYYDRLRFEALPVPPEVSEPPPDFQNLDPDLMGSDFRCPKCDHEWSGTPK